MIRLVDVHFRADETSGTFEIDAVNVPPAFPGSMQDGCLALAIKSNVTSTAAERITDLEDAMARVLRYNANILSPQPGRESNVDDVQPKLGKLADLPPDSPVGDESPTEDVVDGIASMLRTLSDPNSSFSSDRALFPAPIKDAVNFKDVPKHQNAGCGLLLKTTAGDYEIRVSRAVAAQE